MVRSIVNDRWKPLPLVPRHPESDALYLDVTLVLQHKIRQRELVYAAVRLRTAFIFGVGGVLGLLPGVRLTRPLCKYAGADVVQTLTK